MAPTESTGSALTPQLAWLRERHLEAVLAVQRRIDSHPWTHEHWSQCLGPGYHSLVVLCPEPVAYLTFLQTADSADLMIIGVDLPFQGQGWGRDLLAAGIQLLPRAVTTIYLEVRESNVAAIGLYESLGFIQVGDRPGYYPVSQGAREDALVYSLDNHNRPVADLDFDHLATGPKMLQSCVGNQGAT